MTTETLSSPNTHSAGLDLARPRPLFATAIQIAEPIIAAVRPDQLRLPSPCVEFNVKGLLDHLVFVLHRVAALGRGDDAFSPNSMAYAVVEHVDYVADWRAAAAEVEAAWSDDAKLVETIVLPWATMSGAEMLSMYIAEITTHSWDVAKATGQNPAWDEAVCRLALDAMHRDLPIADRTPMWAAFKATAPANFQFDAPFANAVAVSLDAPLIDQLVGWTGRQP
ncbi:MAG: TIGR03086 family metal-binding protein [Ilumatobacteraceae bacterium]